MLKRLQDFDKQVQHEQIRILYQQSPFVFLGIVLTMTLVAVFLWSRADQTVVLTWVTANVLLTLARVVLVKRFAQRQPQGAALMRWGVVFAASSTVSGLLWGSIAVLFVEPDKVETVLMAAIVLTGMSAGSLVPLSAFLPACYGFTLGALTPLAVVMLGSDSDTLVFIGYLVFAFLVVSLSYAVINNRNLAESIRLRFGNLDLLEDFREQKQRADRANLDKSRFLAAISHDLRQPLHAMDLYLGALDNLLHDDEQKQLLAKARQSSLALNRLLSSLMDVSRLDAGEVVIERKLFDIAAVLNDICQEYQEQTAQVGCRIRVMAESVTVDSDPVMLARMLRNLVNNACHHACASEITLCAERDNGQVVVSVCDNGVGIPSEEQEQVFSEFYQLHNPERDRSKGLGLGLAIVKRLADLLQHELSLQSQSGKGSCFRLGLPFVAMEHQAEAEEGVTGEQDIAGLFLVLVDDEADVRNAMRTLLLQWGCELLVADSWQALHQELQQFDYPPPDLVLCDYRLRENRNGIELVQSLSACFNQPLPAIIISGDTDRRVADKARALGYRLLHKPVQPAVLREAVYHAAHSKA